MQTQPPSLGRLGAGFGDRMLSLFSLAALARKSKIPVPCSRRIGRTQKRPELRATYIMLALVQVLWHPNRNSLNRALCSTSGAVAVKGSECLMDASQAVPTSTKEPGALRSVALV